MKKFFSLVLALVMALSLTTIAWGAPTAEETALQTALNAGGTVTLSGDVVVNDGLTVPANTTVVLDLNGKTVSMAVAASAASALITNNGTLTIKDSVGGGKLSYSTTTVSTGYSTSTINNNGVLTVESGIIENTTTASGSGAVYAIDTYGTLTVNGGTISTSKGTAIRQAVFNYDNAVTINGGTISSPYAGLQVHVFNGTVDVTTVINGGSFSGDYAFYTYFYNVVDGSNVDIDVNGGTFDGYVYLYNGNEGSSDYPLDVSISGGTFNDWVGVYTNDASGNEVYSPAITGGTFAVAPEAENVADGLRYDSATGALTTMPTTGVGKYDLYDANGDLYKENITVEYVEAYDDEGAGNIEYYKLTWDGVTYTYFVECSRTKAECYLTLADNLGAYKHLKHVDYVDYVATGKAYTNIGDDCGELDVSAKAKAYVVTDEDGVKTYFVASAAGQKVIKVGNELVAVNEVVGGLVPHVWVVTAYNDKEEPATVKCKNCPATGKLYATKLAAPIGATFDDTQVAGYWVVVNGSAGTSTDKTITSADTFDAGIAMYVGMSVMAAAGSAVVIGKKKD